MKIGLVGFPGSGKSTVFNALTGLQAETGYGATRGKTNLGVVKVPDARVDRLGELYKTRKTTYTEIQFCDVAAQGGARGLDATTLSAMREMDALCQVVRAFRDDSRPEAAAPLQEARDLEAEMVLADLQVVEKRLERLRKERGKPTEVAALERVLKTLEAEQPLRALELSEEDRALFSGYRFLTQKPLLLVLNVDEGAAAAPPPAELDAYARDRGLGLVVLSGQVEMEISQLPAGEQLEFARSLGLAQPARARFIQAAYGLLDLISFLTAGEDECRAWTIRRGTVAQRAAGKIHSDIERGFIRAEVVPFEELVRLGSEARAREAGKLRLEGKEYVVKDGDVAHFRFNV